VANRRRWAHIVQHCRRDGGDPDVQRLGALQQRAGGCRKKRL
jgi:hypothetical protein